MRTWQPAAVAAAALGLAIALVVAIGTLDGGPSNRPPVLHLPDEGRALVGERLELSLGATDPDGDVVTWSATGLPPGARLGPDGTLSWAPGADHVGSHRVTVEASDPHGAGRRAALRLLVRHPPHPRLYVALGDSVASGHGLDWRHWLGRDPCWRDRSASYPALVLAGRSDRGGAPSELALVACSGHDSGDLLARELTASGPLPDAGGRRSQLEWAVRANPGTVTLTVGANDLDFARPTAALTADGTLDEAYLGERLARVELNLERALRRLVDATDAAVVVTTYHDPTAPRPHGVDGCRRECFATATGEAVGRLNARIASVAERFPAHRVAVADVADAFDGRGAPNGRGPDVLRGLEGPSWLPGALTWASGIHPYCAEGHGTDHEPLVSAADCVHPNRAGARAYAAAVTAALDSLG